MRCFQPVPTFVDDRAEDELLTLGLFLLMLGLWNSGEGLCHFPSVRSYRSSAGLMEISFYGWSQSQSDLWGLISQCTGCLIMALLMIATLLLEKEYRRSKGRESCRGMGMFQFKSNNKNELFATAEHISRSDTWIPQVGEETFLKLPHNFSVSIKGPEGCSVYIILLWNVQ